MKLNGLWLCLSLLLLDSLIAVRAQESAQHEHQHDVTEKLGQVHFPISCSALSQPQFTRALALLHSFQYSEAERAFSEIVANDSSCAIAEWGVAMANYHPLWVPPTPTELQKGREAVEKAKTAKAKTQRERDYIAAIETFYQNADQLG